MEIFQKFVDGFLLIGEAVNNFFVFIFSLFGIDLHPMIVTTASALLLILGIIKLAPRLPKLIFLVLIIFFLVMLAGIINNIM